MIFSIKNVIKKVKQFSLAESLQKGYEKSVSSLLLTDSFQKTSSPVS